MANKKDHMEAELKKILAKDIGSSNPVFSPGAIAEMQQVFYLYTDQRQRRADVRDILLTASSLGLDSKFEMAFHLLEDIHDATEGNALDFETFLRELTAKIGSPFNEEGRRGTFDLLDLEKSGELTFKDLKFMSDQLKYGYSEEQLVEIIKAIGGYTAETITFEKFNSYIKRKTSRVKRSI